MKTTPENPTRGGSPSGSASCSRLAKCSLCGHITNDYVYYGSMALAETCLKELPHICGSSCMLEAAEKIEAGEWKLPKLRKAMGGYAWDISKPRHGYDAQPSQAELVNALVHSANADVLARGGSATPTTPNPQ